MKTTATLLGLFIMFDCLFAQSRKIDVPLNYNNDTIYNYRLQDNQLKQLGLDNLYYRHDSINFRFWMDYQLLDFRILKTGQMFCDLYSFVWIIPKGNKQTDYKNRKLVFDKHSIDTDSAVFLWNKIKDYRLYAFPTDTKINGWEHGYDGRTYVTEFSNDTILKYCYYWTPSAQNDTIKEAKVIREFYNLADSTLGVYKRFKQFTNSLPKGAYTWGMINMIKK